MQNCIPPILVEVLAPHFAVRYSCRSVLVLWVHLCYFASHFGLGVGFAFCGFDFIVVHFLGIFVLFGCVILTSRFVWCQIVRPLSGCANQ